MPTTLDSSQSTVPKKKKNCILEDFKLVYFSLRTPPFSFSSAKLIFFQLNCNNVLENQIWILDHGFNLESCFSVQHLAAVVIEVHPFQLLALSLPRLFPLVLSPVLRWHQRSDKHTVNQIREWIQPGFPTRSVP